MDMWKWWLLEHGVQKSKPSHPHREQTCFDYDLVGKTILEGRFWSKRNEALETMEVQNWRMIGR